MQSKTCDNVTIAAGGVMPHIHPVRIFLFNMKVKIECSCVLGLTSIES